MKRYTILFFLSFLFFTGANATPSGDISIYYTRDSLFNKITNVDLRLKEYTEKDTLSGYSTPRRIETSTYFKSRTVTTEKQRDRQGLIVVTLEYEPFLSYVNFSDTVIFNPMMLPVVFDGRILPKNIDFRRSTIINKGFAADILLNRDSIIAPVLYRRNYQGEQYTLIGKGKTFADKLWKTEKVYSVRKQYYITHPDRIKSNALAFSGSPIIRTEVEKKSPFKELISAENAISIVKPDISRYVVKPVFWKFGAKHDLHFSFQGYSDNWNPKTNNNYNIESYQKFTAQYRKNKVSFDHEFEWRFNGQYVSIPKEDKEENLDYNEFLIKDDWLRTYNRLGLDAFIKRWKYIITLEGKTPLFNKYPQKNKKRQAAFLSPLDINFGVGMGYELTKKYKSNRHRKLVLTLDATPLSIKYKYIHSDSVLVYNRPKEIEENKSSNLDWGSTFNINFKWQFNNYTEVSSRAKYFTNYDKIEIEWENNFIFHLNKYLSTKIYLYAKYYDEDPNKKSKKWGYLSYKADLGFGLSYVW